jgi:uncharacterized membrane protein
MKRFTAIDGLSAGALGATVALTAALYPTLPARVPTHFDASGMPDAYADRLTGVVLLPVLALCTWLLVRVLPRVTPESWRARLDESPMDTVAFLLVALFAALQVVVLRVALRGAAAGPSALGISLGAFWGALGLVLPRVRRNALVGIRTPWSLTSDENWARTHRVGGAVFAIAGALAVVAALSGITAVSVALVVVSGLVPAVYSYVQSRRLPR